MTGKKWFKAFLFILLAISVLTMSLVAFVDPFFHYRAPRESFYYRLAEQRSQNDGITKRFDYDAIITGTSMSENFKSSLFDELFGTKSIKIPYSGATYKEIDQNLRVSYESGHNLKYVFRPLDYSLLIKGKDEMRIDMGEYPVWMTNNNPFDDVKYLLNRDVIIHYTLPVIVNYFLGSQGGYTSFDEYSYTGDKNVFGRDAVLSAIPAFDDPKEVYEVTDDEIEMVKENIEQNVVALARDNPDTTFIYFFPPYSMAYWGTTRTEGNLSKQIACIRQAADQMLECDNIHIYSFVFEEDITSNIDLYRDIAHYCPDVNDWIMKSIYEYESDDSGIGDLRITRDNFTEYFDRMQEYLENYDYNSL